MEWSIITQLVKILKSQMKERWFDTEESISIIALLGTLKLRFDTNKIPEKVVM